MYIEKEEEYEVLVTFQKSKRLDTEIKKDDLVYITSKVKQEKLTMRKYIQSIGAKQTHNLEEATIVILHDNYHLDINKYLLIPAGTYYNKDSCLYEIKNRDYYGIYSTIELENSFKIPHFLDTHWKVNSNSEVTPEFILTNPNIKAIQEEDLQNQVAKWKDKIMTNKYTKEDWDGVRDLLNTTDKDVLKLLVTTLNNCNHEEILGRLVSTYMRSDVPNIAKEMLYKKVFSKRPELVKHLPQSPYKWGQWYNRNEILTYCKQWVSKEDLDALNITE